MWVPAGPQHNPARVKEVFGIYIYNIAIARRLMILSSINFYMSLAAVTILLLIKKEELRN